MFIVYDKDMKLKEFPEGVRPLDIFISSIAKERNTQIIEGRSGLVTMGQTHRERPIDVSLALFAEDTQDYRLLRDEAYSFFDDEEFYISESHESGKRYKVTTLNSYIPERLNKTISKAEFQLDIVELPYGESIGTTQDIEKDGINSEGGLWSFGMGLLADNDSQKYTHKLPRFNRRDFKIYNAGNVPIHPFEQELKIKISDVVGSTEFLELKNKTNGTTFRVNKKVNSSQVVVLDGPNITIGSLQALRDTNRKYIELDPFWNSFILTGCSSAKVEFDFRFHYK